MTKKIWNIAIITMAIITAFIWGATISSLHPIPQAVPAPPTATPSPAPSPTAILLPALEPTAGPVVIGPVMAISGDIVEAETGEPVQAFVYVNDGLAQENVTQVNLVIPMRGLDSVVLRVESPGYQSWELGIQSADSSREMSGPVRLKRLAVPTGQLPHA